MRAARAVLLVACLAACPGGGAGREYGGSRRRADGPRMEHDEVRSSRSRRGRRADQETAFESGHRADEGRRGRGRDRSSRGSVVGSGRRRRGDGEEDDAYARLPGLRRSREESRLRARRDRATARGEVRDEDREARRERRRAERREEGEGGDGVRSPPVPGAEGRRAGRRGRAEDDDDHAAARRRRRRRDASGGDDGAGAPPVPHRRSGGRRGVERDDGEHTTGRYHRRHSRNSSHVAVFAMGCFFRAQDSFEQAGLQGLRRVRVGWTGGFLKNPSQDQVLAGGTGHADAVLIEYDSSVLQYSALLKHFFASHAPRDAGGQGADRGSMYRSGIYVETRRQLREAEGQLDEQRNSSSSKGPLTTTLSRARHFWEAPRSSLKMHCAVPEGGSAPKSAEGLKAVTQQETITMMEEHQTKVAAFRGRLLKRAFRQLAVRKAPGPDPDLPEPPAGWERRGGDCAGAHITDYADVTISDCVKHCDERKGCRGFAFRASRKGKAAKCLLKRRPCSARVPTAGGWYFYGRASPDGEVPTGWRATGGDCLSDMPLAAIQLHLSISLQECVAKCTSTPSCKGVSYRGQDSSAAAAAPVAPLDAKTASSAAITERAEKDVLQHTQCLTKYATCIGPAQKGTGWEFYEPERAAALFSSRSSSRFSSSGRERGESGGPSSSHGERAGGMYGRSRPSRSRRERE